MEFFATMAEYLYLELPLLTLIILIILLYNNIVLYRLSFRDQMSVMLICGIVMCISEAIWDICEGIAELSFLSYIAVNLFICSTLAAGEAFNQYFLSGFGAAPKSRKGNIALYVVPFGIMVLLSITSPWTKLVAWVDAYGVILEAGLFNWAFIPLVLAYVLSVFLLAAGYLIGKREKDPAVKRLAKRLLISAALGVAIYFLQIAVLGNAAEYYMSVSPALSICLIYLMTAVNTDHLLKTQAEVDRVESELRVAAGIQMDAMPPCEYSFPSNGRCELRASMHMASDVGGDFYDYFPIGDHKLCFLIADVSGKGMPAALFMMTVKTMISEYAQMYEEPSDIFTKVNERICQKNESGMFVTAWIGIFDTESNTLRYTNAGHNFPLLYRRGEGCTILKRNHGLFLAGMEDTIYRQDEIRMLSGDRLLLYTDGITDAHDPNGKLYGTQKLLETFEGAVMNRNEEVLHRITESVRTFTDPAPQFDDMTMMILTIHERS